jgi:hypothetical protein
MAWTEDAARSLLETFDGSFEAARVVVAAACADEAGIVSHASPADTPAASSRPARSQACDSCARTRRPHRVRSDPAKAAASIPVPWPVTGHDREPERRRKRDLLAVLPASRDLIPLPPLRQRKQRPIGPFLVDEQV